MPLRDIFKRQAQDFLSSRPNRDRPSLSDELRGEWDKAVGRAIDPGREEREQASRAAELAEIRAQKGTGQAVRLDGYAGDWESAEMTHFDDTTAAFALVDREGGEWGQLSAADDGSVVLDVPDDQFSGTSGGAFWRTDGATGIRLDGVELSSDQRRVRVSCDLRFDYPADEPEPAESDGQY
jgi:hypothetical protein